MNKKGQALVEFIIVLPLFIMLLLAVLDYARIMQNKFDLETKLDDIILNDFTNDGNDNLKIEYLDNEVKYTIKKKIEIFSPVLTVFMGSKYEIECERVVYE